MRSVLLKSAFLFLLLGALADGSENDDLVFDQDGKPSAVEIPLIERHHGQSIFHRMKRGFLDWFGSDTGETTTTTTTTTTTELPVPVTVESELEQFNTLDQQESDASENFDKNEGTLDEEDETSEHSAPLILDRTSRESGEETNDINSKDSRNDNEGSENEHENVIGEAAEGRRKPLKYRPSDDEDLAGSGEVEGSTSFIEGTRKEMQPVTDGPSGKARFYRITLTVGEPYRREYAQRNSQEYSELSGNLTRGVETLYNQHIPGYNHFANVVKISPTSDAFTSQVTLDIGSTYTNEEKVQQILENQLHYHTLGNIQVSPEGFTFRDFQVRDSSEPECDPSTELRCRNGDCVPLDSRCDGIVQCDDRSDELDCPKLEIKPSTEFPPDTVFDNNGAATFPSFTEKTEKPTTPLGLETLDVDYGPTDEPISTRPGTDKCRADDMVRCRDGSRYICSVQQCDGTADCEDGGDEVGCPHPGCSAGEFACDVSRCILETQRCDFVENCHDGSDEHDCNYPTCSPDQFRCRSSECIDSNGRCDGVFDCQDRSDEVNCPRCRLDEFECSSGSCVSKSARCDGRNDCPDFSDERDCNVTTCSGDQFRCLDGTCLNINKRCNGVPDCRNSEDESQCACSEGQLPCDNGVCINKEFFCDKNEDCLDGSDEKGCSDSNPEENYPVECRRDEFTCNDNTCIPLSAICNGRIDCPDNSDEVGCHRDCTRNQFQCRSGDCIRADQRCNGVYDCDDGSDEDNCKPETTTPVPSGPGIHPMPGRCPAGQIMCGSDRSCVPSSALCNGIPECRDGTDERGCVTSEGGLNLKTYPSEQIIKENPAKQGREVVFQCRDEGPLRARVQWIRENGLPLPPGSRDFNGRLEIPNIQLNHAGTYICEAIGYPPNTPGRQLSVYLTVEKFDLPVTRPPRVCKYDEATCSNGDCIPKSHVCDGKFDCTDGSDEMRCSVHGCEPNEFRCTNKQCVSKLWRCDGDKDCTDGSDEENCAAPPPGSPCRYNEFECSTNDQCIPKSYHCDMERDCLDGSDELGCSPVYIVNPPQAMLVLEPGNTLVLTCTAIGVPTPEVNWRLNWGHVPSKCTSTSVNGTGTLTCANIQTEDQGAYSCEAMNIGGFVFAVPDTILIVKIPDNVCPKGKFNSEARTPDECISCFCFGVATECHSANLFTYQIPPPFNYRKVLTVETSPDMKILGEINNQIFDVRAIGRDGVQIMAPYSNDLNIHNIPYFALPENYHGSQLKSYGGYLKYVVHYSGDGVPNNAPSVILSGNNYVLMHKGNLITPDYETEKSVRFFYGDWYRKQGRNEILASREDIMMALANVDNILIKAQYDDGPQLDVSITNIVMDTADSRNTGLGAAAFVEDCLCPTGYTGYSCEHCASGYLRRESGPWLGQCYRDEPPCPPGHYGDPSRNIPCQICPCPLTNPSNQFARTCHLGSDGQPTCDCPTGYVGRRCEQCASGYRGNPLIAGDMCIPLQQCDPDGSISPHADAVTGQCHCKQYTTGITCNKCKANTFNLASTNQFGCINCFCMGITNKCVSSNWYRNEIRVSFTSSIRDFSLVESRTPHSTPIIANLRLDTINRQIVYNDFPNRTNNEVYYWQLPSIFLGDQIASYGGNLKYTVRYVPSPGGQSSRNNAADVELISSNDINLLYYSRESPEPNSSQSFTVPLLEQYWQRNDGKPADREHLLMALADVHAIRIKATYTTHTDEVALSSVSLDTAEKYNTGRARAEEVEECSCPIGYKGLSCEDCDVGYTRAIEGLYLGICEPCNCNRHSSQCDPETGICENCADHTTGDGCDVCEAGYNGDATRGTPNDCTLINHGDTGECNCNPAGSVSYKCINRQCECKSNVEGAQCNRCRPSTFGLSAENIDGCNECYCSGVTRECHESSLYVQQIPMLVYDSNHGFTLTDSTRRDVIDDGFELNVAMNEIGYRYPDNRNRRLFWSLPPTFTGNKIKSYGGNLTLTQHITAYPGVNSYKDQDVVLVGNGITLFWTNPQDLQPGVPLTYSVMLRESEWRRLTAEGPRSASRTDLMTVLSNLEAILVRASHSEDMTATYVSDISLDTAVENFTGNRRATQIEACRCPSGYTGTSCETCSRGYYRDVNDRTISFLGSCNQCPCNGNEESCKISRSGHVKCFCLVGYTGQYCQDIVGVYPVPPTPPIPTISPPRINVSINEPEFQIVHIGNTVRYHCSGRSIDNGSLRIKWEKEGGQLPSDRSVDDTYGLLVIRDVKVSDSGIYVCQVSDGINIGIKRVSLSVGGVNPVEPRAIITPQYLLVKEGEPVEFHCEATGNPLPQLEWVRIRGDTNPEATFYDGVWRLSAATLNDAAEYKCIARNSVGTNERTTILYVEENPNKPERTSIPSINPIVSPTDWSGSSGDTVHLICSSPHHASVFWTRAGNLPLPASASQRGGVLTINNPTPVDSGLYVCTATTYQGTETSSTARVTILNSRERVTIKVEPERQVVFQGTLAEVKCIVSGEPAPQIKWTKYGEPILGPNVQHADDVLRIINPQVSDRGVYVCHVTNAGGSNEASAIIEVTPREAPVVELYPQEVQTVLVGGSADFHCRAIAGIPAPKLHWSRQDGRPFGSNVKQMPGGLLRFFNITANDEGSFICTSSNEVGSTTGVARIEVQSMPLITISPANSILQVRLGDRVRLVCSATGQPQPNVVWSKHKNGMSTYDVYSQTASTPHSAVYEIVSVSMNDEGSYTCQATNAAGISEERVQIRIEDDYPPEQPSYTNPGDKEHSQNGGVMIPDDLLRIPNGGKVEMRCQVSGLDQDQIYLDWKRSDHRPLPEGSIVHNGVLNIPAVTSDAAGEYFCLGLNSAGTMLFKAKSQLVIINPPRIELNPTRQTVRPGENPSIICSATGDEPLDIEWNAIGRTLPYSVSHSRGLLQFHGITFADAGKYVCKATNNVGTAEAVAEVLVNEHPYEDTNVRAIEHDVTTYAGSSVHLRCEVREHATIHWSREGQSLPPNFYTGENYLELTQVRPEDSGRYICQIRNAHGVSSDYVNLRVTPYRSQCRRGEYQCGNQECIPLDYFCDGNIQCSNGADERSCRNRRYRQLLQRRRASVTPAVSVAVSQDPVNIGDTIDIRCTCSGVQNPRFHWSRPNHPSLPANAHERGDLLRLTNVAVSDSGIYRCTADTPDGTFQEDFNLIVQGGNNDAPAIETKSAPYGSSLEMDCRVDLKPPVKFQWSKLGGLLPLNTQTFDNKLKLINVKVEDAGTYICIANDGYVNVEVPTVLVVTGAVPFFHQAPTSYITLPPLPDAYLKFSIEVSFKPESYDGIILYNDEKNDGSGDFLILSLVGGYPEFRFYLGSGPAIVRAEKPITLGEWHTIKLQRNHKEGTMLVDGEGPYKGITSGRRQGLDLKEPLYIGGVPDYSSISKQAGASTGFVGCISRLIIGENEIDLIGDQTSSVGITICETCAVNPCNNAGVCQEAATKHGYTCLCRAGYSGKHCDFLGQTCYAGACGEGQCVDQETGFECYCPSGKAGPRCERSININEPAFHDDNAYLAYQTPKAIRRLKLAMNFNPSDNEDGILMYISQNDEGLGDFAALIIKNRHVEFRFDLGSGMAVVRSNRIIHPGVWTYVTASRDLKEGKLSVNGEPLIEGRSPGSARTMTLNTPLYVGGIDRRKITVNKNVEVERSFHGCINELEMSLPNLNVLKSAIDSVNIEDCSVPHLNQTIPHIPATTEPSTRAPTTKYNPCMSNPCIHGLCQDISLYEYSCSCEYGYVGRNCENILKQCELLSPCKNGGTCTDQHGKYKCDCQLGYSGSNCEKLAEISYDVAFRGDGWLELDRSVMTHEEEREVLGFEISTNKSNGLIMWHGQTPNDLNSDDYIALAVVDGYIEYQYNLGSGPALIRVVAQKVNDGERHRIILKRQGSDGSIELNGEHTESGVSDGLQQLLNTRGSVYLGGVPDYAMTYGRYHEGFSGCIYTLEVQDSGAIDIGEKAIRGKNVSPCTSESKDRPPKRGDIGSNGK